MQNKLTSFNIRFEEPTLNLSPIGALFKFLVGFKAVARYFIQKENILKLVE